MSSRKTVAIAAVLSTVLLACGAQTDTPDPAAGDDPAAPTPDEQLPEPPEQEQTKTASEVYEEIAAMDLSYEERLEYLREKAVEEGAVLIYGASTIELQEPWSEGFQEEYPEINHLYVRQGPDDLIERVLAEYRADRHLVDVINVSAAAGAFLYEEGVLAELHDVPVPDGYPERYVESWAVGQYFNPNVIAWNTDAISSEEAPRDWDDFLDPEYSGCILDVVATNFVGALLEERGREATEEWLQGWLDNGGVVRRGHSGSTRALASGEIDCAVYLFGFGVESLIADHDAPMDWYAADPTPGTVTSMYIYEYTPRPHAAALLMHWLLEDDAAQMVADSGRNAVNPAGVMPYERLQAFSVDGTEENERLLPITGELAREHTETIHELLDEYLVPNLVSN